MALNRKAEELWVTNVSRTKDVTLSDLRVKVRAGRSINLLAVTRKGKSRYNFSRAQLDASVESGSVANKPEIVIRKVPPVTFNTRIDIAEGMDKSSVRVKRKQIEMEVPDFPDLDFDDTSEEEFAAEQADMDFVDRAPALAVDPKFKKLREDDE